METIPKSYEASQVEPRWYAFWEERGFFRPAPEGSPYCMVMPPPNVTGRLHMGHALNITLQDILARWRRMQGRRVLWVPGVDHAGIATQNVVERQLAREGTDRRQLGRQAFEQRVWQWKEEAEHNILSQIRRLGCSCDWSRKRFTLDEGLSRAVREVFVQLYQEGLIYRGEYLVNWCPRCSTAISDLEVEHSPARGHLWHIRYPLLEGSGSLVVATTRPETMLGDTAVAVHPEDARYTSLVGKRLRLPLMNREIPVIADSFVDREFGTGAVKVTPGHDARDFEAGRRHQLPLLRVIGEDGRMTEEAGRYQGLDRFQARSRVLADLEAEGLLEGVEEHEHSLGHCQRCGTVIEPLVSTQWFVRVEPLAHPALEAVRQEKTVFVPANYRKIYVEWLTRIHDWCISRQLWWGHRIPAWYCQECREITVARTDPACCAHCGSGRLEQETDVLDTWFSSALWPFSTLGWPEQTVDLKTFYPTDTLVTGFDIIFFWVARMMMMGLRFMGEVPFGQVHINGLVRDDKGRKMSKSRGNVIDPLRIMDEYGTDAVRFTLAAMAVPGTDIPFSESRMSGYRAFCNKIWNASRFLLMNLGQMEPVDPGELEQWRSEGRLKLEERWILSRLQRITAETNENLERFRFHESSHQLYHFFWHEYCDWFLELIKERIRSTDAGEVAAPRVALHVLESTLRLLHPFIPFITEELWQRLPHHGESIMQAAYPEARRQWIDAGAEEEMEQLRNLVTAIRTARSESDIDPGRRLRLQVRCHDGASERLLRSQECHLCRLARLEQVEFVEEFEGSGRHLGGVAQAGEFRLELDASLDVGAERERLGRRILKLEAVVQQLERKLSNPGFLERAPGEVVEGARQREGEALRQISRLKERLDALEDD